MKKTLFTVFAIVAFASASFAHTDEPSDPFAEIAELKAEDKCAGVWGSTRIYALNQGLTEDQADCIAMAAYLKCAGSDNAVRDVGLEC